jgi:predicted amidohydrolase YtcJ
MAARLTAYFVALIVAVTFIAGLIVGAQREDAGPVDLIVVNGAVYTADGENTRAEAVAVQGNKILLVGTNREVQRLRRPQTVVVDAKGGTVLPGFNDPSVDLIESGLSFQQLNLEGAETPAALESALKGWAAINATDAWVIGHGWLPAAFADRKPTRQFLDALVPDRPVLLYSADGETAWANTRALRAAKITRRTPDPDNGVIARDPFTGEPTGILQDEAVDLITRVLPVATADERLAALRAAIDEAHRRGVTSVHALNASPDDLALYEQLRRNEELDLRVYAALRADVSMTDASLDALDELREEYGDDPVFKTGAVTLLASSENPEELRDIVVELDRRGWQVIIQAIGESAVRLAREAVEYASGLNPAPPDRERRHRVERGADRFEGPVDGVQLAVTERRSLAQTIDAYTREAAWASFDEHRKGTLERDMLADIVVLTSDILAPADRIPTAAVGVTIFDGRIVYSRAAESND